MSTRLPAPAFEGKICTMDELAERAAALAHPVVMTNGVFDILHRGHVTYLAQARSLGGSLVVAINSDASVKMLGKGDGLVASHLMTKGGDDGITIPTRYDRSPWYKNEISEITSVHMNGRETYKFAVMAMSDNIKDLMASAGVAGEDVALVIPHQANYRIINEARRRIPDIAPEKFCINIDRYGNTSSASVPILLDEMNRAGKIHEGDLIILAAFGGGLSAGAMIIRW